MKVHSFMALGALCVALIASCQTNDSSAPAELPNVGEDDTRTLGPQGGELLLEDAAGVRIPAGALLAETTVEVVRLGRSESETRASGLGALASAVYTFRPHGTAFSAPVEITLRTNGADGSVEVFRAADEAAAFSRFTTVQPDANGLVTFAGNSFSQYVAVLPDEGSPSGYSPVDLQTDCEGGCTVKLDPWDKTGIFYWCGEVDASSPDEIITVDGLCGNITSDRARFGVDGYRWLDADTQSCNGVSSVGLAGDRVIDHQCSRGSSVAWTRGTRFVRDGTTYLFMPRSTWRGSRGGDVYVLVEGDLQSLSTNCPPDPDGPCIEPGTLSFPAGANEGTPAAQLAGFWAKCGRRIDLAADPAAECDTAAWQDSSSQFHSNVLWIHDDGRAVLAEDNRSTLSDFQYLWCDRLVRDLGDGQLAIWRGDVEYIWRDQGPWSLTQEGDQEYLQVGVKVADYAQVDIYFRVNDPPAVQDPCAVDSPRLSF